MASVTMRVRLDGREAMSVRSLLVTVSVSPRSGAELRLAPGARMDHGLFDISIFEGSDSRAVLADVASTAFGPLPLSAPGNVQHLRAAKLEIWTAEPLPVPVGPKLIGLTPASFRVEHGALTVISDPPATSTDSSAARVLHNTASIAGLVGGFGVAYTAAKHGVMGLTKTAALAYAAKDIRVNAVCPGIVRTPMTERIAESSPVAGRCRLAAPTTGTPDVLPVVWDRERVSCHPARAGPGSP
jgi:NAD(P)-dependent dehydrogenase (short-subunit alcohol dehydrogenase family)